MEFILLFIVTILLTNHQQASPKLLFFSKREEACRGCSEADPKCDHSPEICFDRVLIDSTKSVSDRIRCYHIRF